MCDDGAKGLVSAETSAALDALLQLAIEKASETLMSGELEPKDSIAAVKIIAEASKAAAGCVAKGNGILRAPSSTTAGESPALREPIYTFNDAVTAVCERDPETAYLEPWARVLSRINRLFQRVQKDVEEINSERATSIPSQSTPPRIRRGSPRSPRACRGEPGLSDREELSGVGWADQPSSGNLPSTDIPDDQVSSEPDVEEVSVTNLSQTQSGVDLSSVALAKEETPPTRLNDSPFKSSSEMSRLRSRAPT
jgi:hypothetical protein